MVVTMNRAWGSHDHDLENGVQGYWTSLYQRTKDALVF